MLSQLPPVQIREFSRQRAVAVPEPVNDLHVGTATVVNICSPSYSGSTMLDLMLGHGDDCFSCGEVGFWYRRMERRHGLLACSCGRPNCDVWERLLTVREQDFHRHCLESQDARFLIDSTKRLSWVLDVNRWGSQGAFRAVNVAIWKSPQAYAYSWWKRGKSIDDALCRFVRYFSQLAETRLPIAAVSYEDLAHSPAPRLQELCNVIGMPYFPRKECFWRKSSHLAFGNSGTRETLNSLTPAIRMPASYPQDFERQFFRVVDDSLSQSLRRVVRWLMDHDVCRTTRLDEVATPATVHRPLWYYKQVLHARLRGWARWYR